MKQEKREVISYRKTCKAEGTGLAHYVLMTIKSK
ncbi:MAG: modified peptide precursor CbpA [Thermodesulfobacteriota bacterium]